jgi:hypothetical protein
LAVSVVETAILFMVGRRPENLIFVVIC